MLLGGALGAALAWADVSGPGRWWVAAMSYVVSLQKAQPRNQLLETALTLPLVGIGLFAVGLVIWVVLTDRISRDTKRRYGLPLLAAWLCNYAAFLPGLLLGLAKTAYYMAESAGMFLIAAAALAFVLLLPAALVFFPFSIGKVIEDFKIEPPRSDPTEEFNQPNPDSARVGNDTDLQRDGTVVEY